MAAKRFRFAGRTAAGRKRIKTAAARRKLAGVLLRQRAKGARPEAQVIRKQVAKSRRIRRLIAGV